MESLWFSPIEMKAVMTDHDVWQLNWKLLPEQGATLTDMNGFRLPKKLKEVDK